MSNKLVNEAEFDSDLKQLGDLYEEGKDCVNYFYADLSIESQEKASRLFEILRQMRDIAAVQMKVKHITNDN